MKKLYFLLLTMFVISTNLWSQTLTYRIELWDSWGDAWNGGYVDVLVNGSIVLDNIAVSSGWGPTSYYFEVNPGDQITTQYVAGWWPEENYFFIYNEVPERIVSSGQPPANITYVVPGQACPGNIEVGNDPGNCNAVVSYIKPSSAGAVVTQIDNSELTSGDEFPVGVTEQIYEFDFGEGVKDTCSFTITVNDTEAPVADCSGIGITGSDVLLLWDENNANTLSLKSAMEAAGFNVTMPSVPEYQWNNTNPSLDGFDAVIHLNGTTYSSALPLAAQNALVDFVTVQGKAYIHSEWDAYAIDDVSLQNAMLEITILQRYSGHTENLTYSVVEGQELHPVLEDIPASFVISDVGFSPSNLRSYSDHPAEMLMTDHYGTAAVAVRDFGIGRVVGFNHAGNYTGSNALSNENVQKLFINGLLWATHSGINGVLTLNENGEAAISTEDISGECTDNCGIDTMYLDKYTFDCSNIGENEVTLTVVDVNGNSSTCNSVVTIVDDLAPSIQVNKIDIYLDENGEYRLTDADIEALLQGTTDNCTPVNELQIEIYPHVYDCSQVGEPVLTTVRATDQSGNQSKKWVVLTVTDTFAVSFEEVADIEVIAPPCDTATIIDYPEIIVNDNCNVKLELISGLGAEGMFPVGITTETWVATDAAGNTDTLSFDIVVVAGNALPTLDLIADETVDEDSEVVVELTGISYGEDCEEQVLTITAESLDAVLVDDLLVNYSSGDSTGTIEIVLAPNMTGTTEITLTVEDEGGAEVSQTFILTVNPVNDAPYLVAPVPDQTIHASYILEIPVSSVPGELFDDTDDNELVISVMVEGTDTLPVWATLSGDILICEPMIADTGCVNIVVMATDPSGATATDTFEVCVDGYPTAATDINLKGLEVEMYPNPTNGKVNIKIGSGIYETNISVLDITGRKVLQKHYSVSERIIFDMSGKVAGMYFVHLDIDGERIIKKLIVDNK